MCLKVFLESLMIAIRHMNDFLADIHAIVSVDLADFVDGNDV